MKLFTTYHCHTVQAMSPPSLKSSQIKNSVFLGGFPVMMEMCLGVLSSLVHGWAFRGRWLQEMCPSRAFLCSWVPGWQHLGLIPRGFSSQRTWMNFLWLQHGFSGSGGAGQQSSHEGSWIWKKTKSTDRATFLIKIMNMKRLYLGLVSGLMGC